MRKQDGNALMLIVVLMAAIGLASSAFFINFQASSTTGGGMFSHKRAFYAAEGTLLVVTKVAQAYLADTTNPTSAQLQSKLQTDLPPLIPVGYEMKDLKVEIVGQPTVGPIATGTFKGMNAPQTTMRVSYNIVSALDTVGRSVVHMQATLSLAQVSMFQFLYFIDLLYADFSPGPEMILNGRVHANGDLCLSGATALKVAQVTAAGRLMFGMDSRCAYQLSGDEAYISTDGDVSSTTMTNMVKLRLSNSNGCYGCGGTSLAWADYAPATWNGNALDSAHGVSNMTLPIPSAVQAQVGADGNDMYEGKVNTRNLRFIIDPMVAGEPEAVARQKYAFKSQIRVIAGVWYLKDNADPMNWPGIPIWSDHPGSASDAYGNAIGQDDLRARWSWTTLPRRYSYYEYDKTTMALTGDSNGIISYGNLFTDTAATPPTRRPGHWIGSTANSICASGGTLMSLAGGVNPFDAPITCLNGVVPSTPGRATALLNATRGGLHDGHARQLYPVTGERFVRAKQLPMNFDMKEFQAALQDPNPGELGSYFGAGKPMGEFNGIVFVSTSWPDWLQGFAPPDQPVQPPPQGANNDSQQAPTFSSATQQALPQTLCSNTSSLAGADFDRFYVGATPARRFRIPACENYGAVLKSYPTKIRIINAASLNDAVLTKGLSFVTNIGLYLTGEFNTSSVVTSATAKPWIPALVAADQVTVYSNAWDDTNGAWDDDAHAAPRIASRTTYNLAMLMGWARSSASMSLHVFPSMVEDWRTAAITYNGSTVVGFYPVYERYGRYYGSDGYTYRAGKREINYDKHYQFTANQPPGSPLFFISALLDWKAE